MTILNRTKLDVGFGRMRTSPLHPVVNLYADLDYVRVSMEGKVWWRKQP